MQGPGDPDFDEKIERPFCLEHGPLSLWRVIDFGHEFGPAIVAIATTTDLPLTGGKARILPRFLREPILVQDAKSARARWKRSKTKRLSGLRQGSIFTIDLATCTEKEKSRLARALAKRLVSETNIGRRLGGANAA